MGRKKASRRKEGAHDSINTTSSVKHGGDNVMALGMYSCQWNWAISVGNVIIVCNG